VSGASSYNVQYQVSGSNSWTIVSTSGTSYSLNSLTASTTYNYQVQTVCSSGSSAYSSIASFTTSAAATCGAPSGLSSSSVTTNGATLSWGAASGATSYNVAYQVTASNTWTIVSATVTSYNVTGLTAATTYNFEVQTICSSGSSNYS